MRNELFEATTLTRQGQLMEATALIKRTLGLSTAAASAAAEHMRTPSRGASTTTGEPPAFEPLPGMASDAHANPAAIDPAV